MDNRIYMRGDIYFVGHAASTGCETWPGRPAVIVSNQKCNKHSPVVEMVYLSTAKKKCLPTHARVNSARYPSTALCEQIVSVDKSRLQKYCGRCTPQEMQQIDQALLVSLGLAPVDVQEQADPAKEACA